MHMSLKLLIYLYNSKKYVVINNLNIEIIENIVVLYANFY